MSRRQWVFDALNNKPVERVPASFWFHFVPDEKDQNVLVNPEIFRLNLEGHKRYFAEALPDFVKLMSDGFFHYPEPLLREARNATELRALRPVGGKHPWIERQVELVKALTDEIGAEVPTFYNIFAPATFFKFQFDHDGDRQLADLIAADPEAVKHALDVIAEDVAILVERVISEGGTDGIYLSVQNILDPRITPDLYKAIVAPAELKVLERANRVSDNNILHICGYERAKNDLSLYLDYKSKAVNWAVNSEHLSLADGKKLFGGRAVIGGFDNNRDGLLYSGTRDEVEQLTEEILREAGTTGILLGADCTLPLDVDRNRINWVKEKAASLFEPLKERTI